MISAWGIDHGDVVSKAYLGNGRWAKASDLGRFGLRQVRAQRAKPGDSHGVYRRGPKDEPYDRKVKQNLDDTRLNVGLIAGRDLSKRPPRAGANKVPTIDANYPNAHPIAWGSKKDKRFWMVSGDSLANNKKVLRHEAMHADKSSWRLAQIQSNPAKLGREEARADTLSGSHSLKHKNRAVRSHTDVNRTLSARRNPEKAQAKADQWNKKADDNPLSWSRLRATTSQNRADRASYSQAFRQTQDKIEDAAGGRYRVKQEWRKRTARRAAANSAVPAAVAGGVAYNQYRDKKR